MAAVAARCNRSGAAGEAQPLAASWRRIGGGRRRPGTTRSIRFQHGTEIKQFHPPLPLIRHLQRQLAPIRSEAQLHRVPPARKRKRVESTGETVGHDGEPALASLRVGRSVCMGVWHYIKCRIRSI